MHVIHALNVNDAYTQGVRYLRAFGERQESRAGQVLVAPSPVATVYACPTDRVLFDSQRDANPFFHLFESLYLLAGRRDARWLDRFVKDFSSRFAESDGDQHGSYGFRWRNHFELEGGGSSQLEGASTLPDQLNTIVRLLKSNPADRRAVLSMWDPVADLGADKRDIPCNTHAYFRVRRTDGEPMAADVSPTSPGKVLDITVCCRSNDIVWGAYGANAVHFSILLEYLAGRIGVVPGTYTQISNNYHAYTNVFEKLQLQTRFNSYPEGDPIGLDWDAWDADLQEFMAWTEVPDKEKDALDYPKNPWFSETAEPMYVAHALWKSGDYKRALEVASELICSQDWRRACVEWMERRLARMKGFS